MIFFGCTVLKIKSGDDKEISKHNPGLLVRYKVEYISHYREIDGGSLIYMKDCKVYVKETVKELDMILNGANDKTVGLLYGNV